MNFHSTASGPIPGEPGTPKFPPDTEYPPNPEPNPVPDRPQSDPAPEPTPEPPYKPDELPIEDPKPPETDW